MIVLRGWLIEKMMNFPNFWEAQDNSSTFLTQTSTSGILATFWCSKNVVFFNEESYGEKMEP